MKFAAHPEGYIEPDGVGGYDYVYQYKDHLGNIRLSYTNSNGDGIVDVSEIVEESNYYPFGLKHQGYNSQVLSEHKYKYNGKELQDELDLNWYDYGARFYDPATGRWFTPDALAEKYYDQSTYTYALNNPIYYIDPDGNQVEMCCGWLKKKVLQLQNAIIDGYNSISDNFVFEASGKVDIGVQAGAKGKIGGVVDANVNVNLASIELVSGKADLTNPANPESYTGDYAGKDGNIDISHSAGLEVGVAGKPLIGGDITATHVSDDANSLEVDGGVYLIVPLTETKSRSNNGSSMNGPVDKIVKDPSAESQTGKKGEFYGVNLGVGAALGLGVQVNLKIGLNFDNDE